MNIPRFLSTRESMNGSRTYHKYLTVKILPSEEFVFKEKSLSLQRQAKVRRPVTILTTLDAEPSLLYTR